MKYFLRRYREGSRLSRRAFWVVIVTALLGLAMIPIKRDASFGSPWDLVLDALTLVMIVGLIVQGVSLQRDERRRRRTQR